jgi:hypothetical protein
MKNKKIIIIIIVLLALFFLFAGYFIYKDNKLKESNNVIIPKVKYTCTTTAINADDMIYYTKIVIEGTNAGRIVNYYNGVQTLYKSDETYKNNLNSLAKNNETLYQDNGNNSIYTYTKLSADENNNNVVAKTLKDLNNLDMKCVKEKLN